jgi:hypothetical protein
MPEPTVTVRMKEDDPPAGPAVQAVASCLGAFFACPVREKRFMSSSIAFAAAVRIGGAR